MTLVDTSSWIHFLRPHGDPEVRGRVEAALVTGQACWCPPVQLELWNGARGPQEKKALRDFARTLPEVRIDEGVWQAAYDLARRARARGVSKANLTRSVTAPATDVLIAACARRHGARLEYADTDFDLLEPLDEPVG